MARPVNTTIGFNMKTSNAAPFLALATTFASTFLTMSAWAADAPDYTATTNVNLVSQYRFRGIDQTWGKPAVQGGADLTTNSGLYLGTWASNVSGNSYPGGSLELDYYGGYNGKLTDDWGYTVGGYGYWYPGANYSHAACPSAAFSSPCSLPSQSFNTFELNAGVNWKWFSYKLSVSTGDYFGANTSTGYDKDTKGTMYHDVTLTFPVRDDISLIAHLGHTDVKAQYAGTDASYTDYRLTLSKTWTGGWSASAALVGATNNTFFRPPTGGLSAANGDTRSLNRNVLVLQVGRSF